MRWDRNYYTTCSKACCNHQNMLNDKVSSIRVKLIKEPEPDLKPEKTPIQDTTVSSPTQTFVDPNLKMLIDKFTIIIIYRCWSTDII